MGQRLLVVEDDPVVLSMLEKILALDGFQVTSVSEGTAALDAARASDCDAVLLDVMLPGRDGVSILADIRESADLRALPVVMLTAKADDESTWAGWRAGCDYYMTKPFDPEELTGLIRRLTAERRGA